MSKRRLQDDAEEEPEAPEKLTPEERKIQRRREKAQARSGRFRRGLGTPLRRGLILGVPVAIIAVVVFIILFNPFNIASPCLSLSAPSASPQYPPAGSTNFNNSWCPQGASAVLVDEPLLKIVINGTQVPLPTGLGVNHSFAHYTCTLPISTPTTSGVVPEGVFIIASPWFFSYNLSWFFGAWAATSATVAVDSTHPSQPVEYSPTDLLGFTADSTHHIDLFVDGQPSNAGPSLVLPTLPYLSSPSPMPGCIARVYGTGHTIVLEYTSAATATSGTSGIRAPALATGPGNPEIVPQYWDGPLPRMTPDVVLLLGSSVHADATLAFLALKSVAILF